MAAITGLRQLSTAFKEACSLRILRRSSAALRPMSLPRPLAARARSRRSMPAEKCFPSPVSTTTRPASVSSTHLNMSTISSQNAAFMALTFSGRLIATWAIRSFSSTRKAWYSVTLSSSTACAWAYCQAIKSTCLKRHNYNNSRPKVDARPCDAAHALHNICARQLRQLLTLHNAIDRITRAVRMLLALQSVDVRVEPGELQSELLCEVEVIEY